MLMVFLLFSNEKLGHIGPPTSLFFLIGTVRFSKKKLLINQSMID